MLMTAAVSSSAGRSHQRSQPVSVVSEDAVQANGRELPGNRELVPVPWLGRACRADDAIQLWHDGHGYLRRLPGA